MDFIVFNLYRLLLKPLYLIVKLIVHTPIPRKLKDALLFRIDNFFTVKESFDSQRPTLCVHAASGEIEYALPVIRLWKSRMPHWNVVVTLSSPSVLKILAYNECIDAYGPAPLDLKWIVKKFILQWKPKIVLFSRTDVWPEFSYQLKKNSIPSFIFSCTFTLGSRRDRFLSRALNRFALNQLNALFTVSKDDEQNLKNLEVSSLISTLGDTRYDQVEYRKTLPKKLKLKKNSRNIFVGGSLWSHDLKVLLTAVSEFSHWQWIFVPHDIEEDFINELKKTLESQNPQLRVKFYSELSGENKDSTWDLLIVDSFGILFNLYSLSDLSFVGGSFKDKVHSVMEPLSYPQFVCVGPYYHNNREAIEFSKIMNTTKEKSDLNSLPQLSVIKNTEELVMLMKKIESLSSIEKEKFMHTRKDLLKNKLSASERVFDHVKNSIKP